MENQQFLVACNHTKTSYKERHGPPGEGSKMWKRCLLCLGVGGLIYGDPQADSGNLGTVHPRTVGGNRSGVTLENRRWNTDASAKRSKRMC